MAQFTRIKIWVSGEVLYAADLNGEFNNLLNGFQPSLIDSAAGNPPTLTGMRATTNPGGFGTESLPVTLLDDIKQIKYQLNAIQQNASGVWYGPPITNLADVKTSVTKQHFQQSWYLNGSYGLLATPATEIDGAFAAYEDMTIVGIAMFVETSGVSGSTTFDLLIQSVSGGSRTSIFTATPSLPATVGNNAFLFWDFTNNVAISDPPGSTQPVLVSTLIPKGSMITCDLLAAQPQANGTGIILLLQPS